MEVRRYGVGVSLVCPGLTATDFQSNAARENFEPLLPNDRGMSAEKVAEAIVKAVERNRRSVPLTAGGRMLWWLDKLSPSLVDTILYRMYGQRVSNP